MTMRQDEIVSRDLRDPGQECVPALVDVFRQLAEIKWPPGSLKPHLRCPRPQ
jgi:hypothetical protein